MESQQVNYPPKVPLGDKLKKIPKKTYLSILIACVLILAIGLGLGLGIPALTSPLRRSKVEKLELGMSKEEAESICHPYFETSKDGNQWYYYGDSAKDILDKINKNAENISDFDSALEKELKLYEKLESKKFKFMMLEFENNALSKIIYDTNHKYVNDLFYGIDVWATEKEKTVESCTLSTEEIVVGGNSRYIKYKVDFTDGSMYYGYIPYGIDTEETGVKEIQLKTDWFDIKTSIKVVNSMSSPCTKHIINEKCICYICGEENHLFENGECSVCGQAELTYELNESGTGYVVTGVAKEKENMEITIPSYYEGKPTLAIGDDAFSGLIGLCSIVIPNSIETIGSDAFNSCYKLVEVINKSSLHITAGSWGYGGVGYYAIEVHNGESKISTEGDYIIYTYGEERILVNYVGSDTDLNIPDGITEINQYAFSYCSNLTSIVIPDSVETIGSYAFEGCSNLTSVTIGSGVTSIGDYAFRGCSNIESVYITDIAKWCSISFSDNYANPLYDSDNAKLYLNGELITGELVIPEGATSIGSYAFSGYSQLTSVTIPNSVETIGSSAFSDCSSLESITIPFVGESKEETENTHFGYIFGNNSYVPSSLKTVVITGGTTIGSNAFYNYRNLTSIDIPDSVESIGSNAFYNCRNLTSITIPDSVETIGSSAFYDCYKLVEVINKSSLNITVGSSSYGGVGYYAKQVITNEENSKLSNEDGFVIYTYGEERILVNYVGSDTDLNIPDGITEINQYAFSGCSNLTSIDIPDGVKSIGEYAFIGCSNLTSVTIGSGVTSIGYSAFEGCSNIKSVYITDIAKWCSISFSNYYANPLRVGNNAKLYLNGELITGELVIPDSVETIGSYAFYNCSNLTSIDIPDSVESIGSYAFSGCSNLTSIVIHDSVETIGDGAFDNCVNLTIYCYASSKPSGWHNWWNIDSRPVVWGYRG